MNLTEAIQAIPAWNTLPPDDLLTALQAVTVTTTNPELLSYDGVGEKIGFEQSIKLQAVLEELIKLNALGDETTAVLKAADKSLTHGRMNFSLPFIQEKLTELGAVPALASFVGPLKAIGVQVSSPWANTTLADVEAAVNELQILQQQQLAQAKRTAQATALRHAIEALEAGNTYTNAELLVLVQLNLPSE